jgi:hypothetical protein
VSSRPSRLRRARRVIAGGLVGGAFVVLDRRLRRRDPRSGQPRGSDPLAAFAEAPCYREAPPAGGSKIG